MSNHFLIHIPINNGFDSSTLKHVPMHQMDETNRSPDRYVVNVDLSLDLMIKGVKAFQLQI